MASEALAPTKSNLSHYMEEAGSFLRDCNAPTDGKNLAVTGAPSRNGRMRIAQVASLWASIPPKTYGGIELLVHLLIEELIRRGHEVTLFASGDSHTSAKLHAVCERNILEAMERGEAY